MQESKFLCSVKKGGRETTRVEMNTHVWSKGNAFALRLVWRVVLKNWSTNCPLPGVRVVVREGK